MTISVDFDTELYLGSIKIENIFSNGILSSEFYIVKLFISQLEPKLLFRFGHIFPKFSPKIFLGFDVIDLRHTDEK